MSRRSFWISIAVVFSVEHLILMVINFVQYEYLAWCCDERPAPSERIAIVSLAVSALALIAASIVLYIRSRRVTRPQYLTSALIAAGFLANFGVPLLAMSVQTVVLSYGLHKSLFYLWLIGIGAFGMLPDKEPELETNSLAT